MIVKSVNKIKNILAKPYPFTSKIKDQLFIAFTVFIFVFLFLLLFKPFDLYKLTSTEVFYYSLIYSGIPFLVILINYFIFPKIFKSFFITDSWTICKEIIFVFEIIFFSSLFNWVFSDFSTFNQNDSEYSLLYFTWTSFSVSFFPLLIHIYFTEKRQSKRHNKIIKDNSEQLHNQNSFIKNKMNVSDIVELKGENKDEFFSISINKLLYISSEKNYASIFCLDENYKIKEKVIRASLNKLEKQLHKHKTIIRCHKSYIVNSIHVTELLGNTRNYTLLIDVGNITIPVSRKFPKEQLYSLFQKQSLSSL